MLSHVFSKFLAFTVLALSTTAHAKPTFMSRRSGDNMPAPRPLKQFDIRKTYPRRLSGTFSFPSGLPRISSNGTPRLDIGGGGSDSARIVDTPGITSTGAGVSPALVRIVPADLAFGSNGNTNDNSRLDIAFIPAVTTTNTPALQNSGINVGDASLPIGRPLVNVNTPQANRPAITGTDAVVTTTSTTTTNPTADRLVNVGGITGNGVTIGAGRVVESTAPNVAAAFSATPGATGTSTGNNVVNFIVGPSLLTTGNTPTTAGNALNIIGTSGNILPAGVAQMGSAASAAGGTTPGRLLDVTSNGNRTPTNGLHIAIRDVADYDESENTYEDAFFSDEDFSQS